MGAVDIAMVAALLVLRVPGTRPPAPPDADPTPLIHRAVIRSGLALFAGVAATAGFLFLAGLRATASGIGAWSVVPLVYGGVVVCCRMAFARLPDRLRPLRLGAGSLGACAILVVLAGVPSPAGMVAGAAVLGVGVAFLTP